jgi:hypothetical protein
VSDGRAIQFATVALVTGIGAFFAARVWGITERLESSAIAELGEKDPSRVWITPGEDAAGLRQSGSKASVWVWNSSGARLRSRRDLEISPPFAISPDASRIASVQGGFVRVDALFSPSSARATIRLDRPPAAIAFAGNDRLALLYADGRLETRDLQSKKVLASRVSEVNRPGPLVSFEQKLAYSRPQAETHTYSKRTGCRWSSTNA